MWGWVNYNGVEFFLEAGREKPPFFPEKRIPSGFCPHITDGEPTHWNDSKLGIFWWDNTGADSFYQPNVKVTGNEIVYTGMSCLRHIVPLLKITNYIPLYVSNVRLDLKTTDFLQKLQNEVVLSGRSVVLSGDNMIPLPKFVERLK